MRGGKEGRLRVGSLARNSPHAFLRAWRQKGACRKSPPTGTSAAGSAPAEEPPPQNEEPPQKCLLRKIGVSRFVNSGHQRAGSARGKPTRHPILQGTPASPPGRAPEAAAGTATAWPALRPLLGGLPAPHAQAATLRPCSPYGPRWGSQSRSDRSPRVLPTPALPAWAAPGRFPKLRASRRARLWEARETGGRAAPVGWAGAATARTLTFLALRRGSAQRAAPQQGEAGTGRPTLHAALLALRPIRARLLHARTPALVSAPAGCPRATSAPPAPSP